MIPQQSPLLKRLPALCLAALILSAGTARGVDLELTSPQVLNPGEVLIGLDSTLTVDVVLTNPVDDLSESIQGFQLAISHDEAFLAFESATWEGTDLATNDLRAGAGPEFYSAQAVAGGMTVGCVFDLEDVQGFLLGQGTFRISRLTYTGIQSTPDGATTDLAFATTLGDPAVENKIENRAGVEVAPENTSGLTVIVGGESAYSIHFTTAAASGDPGGSIDLDIELVNSPLPVSGFSFGIAYDGQVVRQRELSPGPGLLAVIDAPTVDYPFYAAELHTDGQGVETGITVALLLSDDADDVFLDPLQSPHHIFTLGLDLVGADGESTAVSLTSELGDPAVAIQLDRFGTSQEIVPPSSNPATTVAVQVGMAGAVPFIRGDVDQSGKANITDVINMLRFQFNAGDITLEKVLETTTLCLGAFDVDGNDAIEINDPVTLLSFIFGAGGRRPPAPFPDCGLASENVPANLVCQSFDCQ